jgi:hypothetical protein
MERSDEKSSQVRINEEHLRVRQAEARELIEQLDAFEIEWIPRTDNIAADTLTRCHAPEEPLCDLVPNPVPKVLVHDLSPGREWDG